VWLNIYICGAVLALCMRMVAHVHCVHEKNGPSQRVLKSSKLASFVQLQFNSMNICIFNKNANFSENLSYCH